MIELILGGARSGKSALAQERAEASGHYVVFAATARADDPEMAQRISMHKATRPDVWLTVEEPLELARVLQEYDGDRTILVDCLTLWVSNLLMAEESDSLVFKRERSAFFEAIKTLEADLILVSNETGMGVIPMGALSRRFVDESGRLHQEIAALADRVTLTVAGLPMTLKGSAP